MHIFAPAPFARIAIAFALGIISAKNSHYSLLPIFACGLASYFLLAFASRRRLYSRRLWLGLLGLTTIYIGGWSIYTLNFKQANPHLSKPEIFQSKKFLLWVNSPLNEKGNYKRGEGKVIAFTKDSLWIPCNYNINITLDNSIELGLESLAIVRTSPDSIRNNDDLDFNFKEYYATQGIFLTEYITSNKATLVDQKELFKILKYAYQIRLGIEAVIDQYFSGSNSGAILKALTVGQKNDLDTEVKKSFSTSGTMHVLAVSGLHVGIFYGLFLLFFKSLLNTRWRALIIIFIISQLWLYALVTGLSPSVIRAVTMFSILIMGKLIKRKSNPYNLIFASAFMILLISPGMLFNVGFQLSYAAVLSIIFFTPRIDQFKPQWMPGKVWALLSVSLAAQIGTLPLTLFYFGKFPTYFLISNLLVIPAVFLILNVGFIFLALGFATELQTIVAKGLNGFIKMMLTSVNFLNKFPMSTIEVQVFTGTEVILFYALIASLSFFWVSRRYGWILGSLMIALLFGLSRFISILTYY